MNECAHRGFLVGSTRELPADATDFQWGLRLPAVGCNRLRCSACGAIVRQHAGWLVDREQVQVGATDYRARLRELYDREAWTGLPYVQPDDVYRVYVCHCRFVMESYQLALGLSTDGLFETEPIPWSCCGHPEVSLPFVIDGVTLSTESDVTDAVRRAFTGWQPAGLDREVFGTWVNRVHARLAGTALATSIEQQTVEGLSDADPSVRAGALRFLPTHRNVAGFHAAAKRALDGTEEVASVAEQLVDSVARIYEYDVIDEPRLRDWARAQALRPGARPAVIEALATRDPQWLSTRR